MRRRVYWRSDGTMRCSNNLVISVVKHVRYRECLRNCASRAGQFVLDGCSQFVAAGPEGTVAALGCATYGCHWTFHRKEEKTRLVCDCLSHDPPAPPPASSGA